MGNLSSLYSAGLSVIAASGGFYFVWVYDKIINCGAVPCGEAILLGLPFIPLVIVDHILSNVGAPYNSSWIDSFSPLRPFFISGLFIVGFSYTFLLFQTGMRVIRQGFSANARIVIVLLSFILLSSVFLQWMPRYGTIEDRLNYCDRGFGAWGGIVYRACVSDVIYYLADTYNLPSCPRRITVFPFMKVPSVPRACVNDLLERDLEPFCLNHHTWSCYAWQEISTDKDPS